jgi:hypothetical protein
MDAATKGFIVSLCHTQCCGHDNSSHELFTSSAVSILFYRYLSELLVAANESKMLKKQQRDAIVADEVRELELQHLMGQSSPDRLRNLMEKAKAQIIAEVFTRCIHLTLHV